MSTKSSQPSFKIRRGSCLENWQGEVSVILQKHQSGFMVPKEAIESTYIDKKCPFAGNVSIRGRILSDGEDAQDHCHPLSLPPLHLKVQPQDHVHAPVALLQGRPTSSLHFNVLKVPKATGTKKRFQKF
ncbi:hypothetical protein GH733_002402 [Mirounga leonina]|nr:hypothetical protein GH733_002402 [Mirounga leonina]